MSDRRPWEPLPVEEAVERVADAGVLTERQAEIYVRREIEGERRQSVAEALEISVKTVDNTLLRARELVEQAEDTVDAIDDIRYRPLPSECNDCGTALGAEFSTSADGAPICLECAGIDG